jgi:hypothetical protein
MMTIREIVNRLNNITVRLMTLTVENEDTENLNAEIIALNEARDLLASLEDDMK